MKNENKRVGLADLRRFINLQTIKYRSNCNKASVQVGCMQNMTFEVSL